MAVPSRRVATGAALLACSVIQAGCSSAVSDPAPFANGRYQQPTRFDDIYRNRAPDVVRYDRYTLVSTRPDDAQRDPLNQIVDITMPAQLVKTVGEGFRYLLLESGYSLCSATTSAFLELLSRPLPAVQRDIGPVRLSEALQIVAGPAWRLKVDDVNREICFELRDQYRSFAAPLPAPVSLVSQHAPVSLPPVIQPARTGGAAGTVNAVPRNPFTGDTSINSTPGTVQKPVLTAQNQSVPSPVLTVAKTPAAQKSAALSPAGRPPVPPPAVAPKAASSQKTPVTAVHPVTVQPATVNAARQTVPVRPVTSLPPAPPVSGQAASSYIPGAPVTPPPVGQTWRAEPGSTLKETLTGWASRATCSNGGNWVVIWPVSLDYRIDAPLVFHGNFESVLVQVFDLYRKAEKPLFAEANRIQCLISVSDTPTGGGH
ncbi:TPA: TcpQ domain-containing protein [Klebsiella pneumoniae]|uniref:PFGI-1 class ICE element type IV pilus protein PilL2 n=1 Tax=Enterobacteriaceae TaxID=543 RepID=UPI000E2CB338|nr:TcpQ domain-containing protein [Klebsiella pneumoniae]HAT7495872.1 pilus assembly protein PilL [Raoultella ornithinolytica]HCM9336022.1 TcpQ domain-containing protein [Enterobacter asburiae]EKX3053592.1 TcpQ domain-containing protein [Klebsiella pneumoniae]MBL9906842.1 TcpQ domain-containing protein [Klebsiella pneumoniae]WVM55636.1 TcpQ domain-containing protein [Klebsiella pneumoniae]